MKTFEEWFEEYCAECDRRLTAMDYINHINHKFYFQVGWNARQKEIDHLKEENERLQETINQLKPW